MPQNREQRRSKSKSKKESGKASKGRSSNSVCDADGNSAHGSCGDSPMRENVLYSGDIATDPNGSYTGRPENLTDTPVQDADDL